MGAPLSAMGRAVPSLAMQQGVVREAHHLALLQHELDGALQLEARLLVDDMEDLRQRLAERLGLAPAGQPLGHGVHPGDAPGGVGGDDPVADGVQGGAALLLGPVQRGDGAVQRGGPLLYELLESIPVATELRLHPLALGDVADGGDEEERLAVAVSLQRSRDISPDDPAALVEIALFPAGLGFLPTQKSLDVVRAFLDVVRVGDLLPGPGAQLVLGVAQDRRERLVDPQPARDLRHGLAERGVFKDGPEPHLAVVEGFLRRPLRVWSRNTSTTPVTAPRSSRIGAPLSAMGRSVPSLATSSVWFAKPDDHPVAQHARDGALHLGAGLLVDDPEHLGGRPAPRLGLGPAGERLGHRVHLDDGAGRVGGDDRVADAVEGRPEPARLGLERGDLAPERVVFPDQPGLFGPTFAHRPAPLASLRTAFAWAPR